MPVNNRELSLVGSFDFSNPLQCAHPYRDLGVHILVPYFDFCPRGTRACTFQSTRVKASYASRAMSHFSYQMRQIDRRTKGALNQERTVFMNTEVHILGTEDFLLQNPVVCPVLQLVRARRTGNPKHRDNPRGENVSVKRLYLTVCAHMQNASGTNDRGACGESGTC